jgi:nucleotide-binding universal stress UspA family protein
MTELGQRLFRVMKILVPVDGSRASIRAVKLAIDQAKAVAGASIVVVNVQNLSTLGLAEGAGILPLPWIEKEEERASSEALQEAITACREAEVTYVTRSERGGIAETIDRAAREEQVTHIMGTRGLGGVRGLLLGSVTTQLLHLAEVPVTLVK